MKTVQLKEINEKIIVNGNQEVDLKTTTAELIRTACNSPIQGGYTASEMIDRIRILDFLKVADDVEVPQGEVKELQLEDADFANLAVYVKATKWTVLSREIVEFVKQF